MKQFNCPNCGAPIASEICPYCGTTFLDWSCLELHKDNWIKIKIDGKAHLIKAALMGFDITYNSSYDSQFVYIDDKPMYISSTSALELRLDLSARPFKIPGQKNALMLEIDPEVADLYDVSDILKGAKET